MKRTIVLPIVLMAIVLLVFAAVLLGFRGEEKLSETEKFAMEALPGYMFEYEGTTNVIHRYGRIKRFQSQHRLMPYLLLVADKFKVYDWPKEWPIRINETENEVIITWPDEGEFVEERRCLWGAPYLLEVVIDKRTMRIVSATRGG